MNLKKIKIQNFKKIGSEVTFKLKPGLNLIKSEINGTGKTTLLSAITFLLWNKNGDTKGSSKSTLSTSELINDINKKELLVEGYFDNGYIIRRGLKPNIFEILDENGNNLADRSSKTIDQDFLETELLGYNYETFMSTIFLNSKPNSIPFIYMSNTQRKEYIEKILDLRIIYHLNDNLKSKISNNKSEIQNCSKSIEWSKDNLKVLTDELQRQRLAQENQKLEIQQFYSNKENKIQANLEIIKSLTDKISEIKNKNTSLQENLKNNTFTDKINENIEAIELDIEALKNNPINSTELESSKLQLMNEIEAIKESLITETLNAEKLKDELAALENEVLSKDENALKTNLELIKAKLQELQNEVLKRETEKELYLKNKDNYLECGDCSKVKNIIGFFNIQEHNIFLDKVQLVKEQLNVKIQEIENDLSEINTIKIKIQDIKSTISTANSDITVFESSIASKESEINNINFKIKEQELLKQQKIADKENQIINLKKDIESIKEKIDIAIENNCKEIADKENQIKGTEKTIADIKAEQAPILIEVNGEPLNDCKNKILELEKQYDDLNEQKIELEELKNSINSKDIKEQALKSYIPLFEDKVNSLISRFTEDDMFTIKAKLTEDFDIDFTKNGKPLNMFSLSEGQKASITFAFTFAFQFLLDTKNQIKESTLFIDEILDIALSSGRLNSIIEYLKEVSTSAGNKSVYIISHNSNLQLELFDNIIDVSIENGFSKYSFPKGDSNE